MNRKIAIVTGASSGLGREFVRHLDNHTQTLDEIWIIARRTERLIQLAKEITNFKIRILSIDLTSKDDLLKFKRILYKEQPRVRLLINSAGYGIEKSFQSFQEFEIDNTILLNNYALSFITHSVIPYMMKNSNIIQLGSASAFLPQKGFSLYAASKSFVLSFSLSLHAELKKNGIYVTCVCPGPVDTEFLKISNEGNKQKIYKKICTVSPRVVAYQALKDAKDRKMISVYGLPMKALQVIARMVPYSLYLN